MQTGCYFFPVESTTYAHYVRLLVGYTLVYTTSRCRTRCAEQNPLEYFMVILYVDDDADDLQLFGEAVRQVDSSITFVPASKRLKMHLDFLSGEIFPDLIFMDINMPVMNGLMCLAAIRSNPVLEHLPVVMLSTSGNDKEINQSKSLGADFIVKPNTLSELVNLITKGLKYNY